MTIGIVLPSLPGYSETFFKNKILGLQQEGVKIILFINDSGDYGEFLNCKVVSGPSFKGNKIKVISSTLRMLFSIFFKFPKRSWKLFQLNKKDKFQFVQNCKTVILNQFLLKEKLDWLHFGFGTMVIGRENVAQVIEAKMAVSFRGFDIGIYPVKNRGCYNKLWLKVDKIHVISDDIKDLVLLNGFKHPQKIVKITPAIDTLFFKSFKKERENKEINILTIGRLHWKKGFDYTLQALLNLKGKGFKFHYTIVGDGVERERLVFAVHQLGLKSNVTFKGKLAPQEIKDQFEQADLYIQYSNQEGFCNAVLEAQAMGKICIVSDAEGLTENVINQETGFVIKKRSPLTLSNKIIEVFKMSEEEKNVMSQKAISRVNSEFSISKQKKEFVSFYKI